MNYLLDTNILLIYARDTEFTRKLEEELRLFEPNNNLVLSVVSLGEIKSIGKQNNWGEKKIKRLFEILNLFLIADINVEEIIERYAEIDTFSQGKLDKNKPKLTSRNMGKNDLWIAATASVLDLELLTTDSDFDHLSDRYIKLRKIDQEFIKNKL